ncbi:unnamed protein product [Thlaspi arvense]|uniref:Cytochrome P450 n=1 Tax=Thlaspi arvense TaxID=13288 RepID=A0AAU9SSK4_THLAR|nr:unnamed protein product [Thlaspi arvense]
MEFLDVSRVWYMFFTVSVVVLSLVFFKLFLRCWILPVQAQKKLRENGFVGPPPSFALGNIIDMKKLKAASVMVEKISKTSTRISHDIHSIALPYFARWQQQYGKLYSGHSHHLVSYLISKFPIVRICNKIINYFNPNRNLGVPFSNILSFKQTFRAKELGREIDGLLLSIINERKRSLVEGDDRHDLLGMLLKTDKGKFTPAELVDECKTFFFAGHETSALALTWTFMLLAVHPEWQDTLREEIRQVIRDSEIDYNKLAGLKKMRWVMNEVLRLYPSAPNAQRQARGDIKVNDRVIPNGTNIWIDVVAMHHDVELWEHDGHEFRPERFDGDLNGGCKSKMGFMPFGFGGRICIGRSLSTMQLKIVLSLVLSRFEVSVSPGYGLQLIVRPL